jgi:hypothetical protein
MNNVGYVLHNHFLLCYIISKTLCLNTGLVLLFTSPFGFLQIRDEHCSSGDAFEARCAPARTPDLREMFNFSSNTYAYITTNVMDTVERREVLR